MSEEFEIWIDPGNAPSDLITELLLAINALHVRLDGRDLEIVAELDSSLSGSYRITMRPITKEQP